MYSDREMARDIVTLMRELGHERFSVVGHDRGSYVAYRAALDHPECVAKLVVLDSVPIVEALERADAHFAEAWWHWFFFASSQAEGVISRDPLSWYQPDVERMGRENHHDLVNAISDPSTVMAMLEDYRASLHVDRANDETDRAEGRHIECQTLVAWSQDDDMEELYGDPTRIWQEWCALPPQSAVIHSGHHMAEENPQQLSAVLMAFLDE